MSDGGTDDLLELLDRSPPPGDVAELVLAALAGREALEDTLAGKAAGPVPGARRSREGAVPGKVFLEEIAVEGFRGIGPRARLQLAPGPGLTLVVGRNGSGKSSFAEALELLLTDQLVRWEGRTKVWKQGWRNLQHDGPAQVSATFRVDGKADPLVLERVWGPDDEIAACWPPRVSGSRAGWDGLGWEEALRRYRPLLSYSELGVMFSTRAADLYEALHAVLGLEGVEEAARLLREARLERQRSSKDEQSARQRACELLRGSDDARAPELTELLSARGRDPEEVRRLAGAAVPDATRGVRELAELALPERDELRARFAGLAGARGQMEELAREGAERLGALADLLEAGLRFQHEHGPTPPADCPLCGAPGRIDANWSERVRLDTARLRERSRLYREAREKYEEALHEVRELLPAAAGPALDAAAREGLDTTAAAEALGCWRALDEADMEREGRSVAESVLACLAEARARARERCERVEDAWRPVQAAIEDWVLRALRLEGNSVRVKRLERAEAWLKAARGQLRRERLAPIAEAARSNWEQLRHESGILLADIELRTLGQQRYTAFDVTVEGADASAYGVMSQGELSALAVSVFLPRAALPGTPFGFALIDDPVQSMDPAKVDGLARVLERAAQERQVIVLTHDERLAEAIRRLEISARIMRVQRRARSRLEIVASNTPSERHIEEARAILKTEELSAEVRARVVGGFCRSAIEAACGAVIRRRALAAGEPHASVEERLGRLTTLTTWLAEVFELSHPRGREVEARVKRLAGEDGVRAVRLARKGAHAPVPGDLVELVRGAELLVRALEGGASVSGG
jgi:energy-coupling factor transporter ATP-binding protein EcfA2